MREEGGMEKDMEEMSCRRRERKRCRREGRRKGKRKKETNLSEKLPRHSHGLLSPVSSKREVPQHLEEGVMTRRMADLFQIIVLSADSDEVGDVREKERRRREGKSAREGGGEGGDKWE